MLLELTNRSEYIPSPFPVTVNALVETFSSVDSSTVQNSALLPDGIDPKSTILVSLLL